MARTEGVVDEEDVAAEENAREAFIRGTSKKYEEADDAADREDEPDAKAETDDSTDEEPDEDTPADDPDGDAAESAKGSTDDGEDDHPGEESSDDADADETEADGAEATNEGDDEEPEYSDELSDILAKAEVTLDDVTDPIAKKALATKLKQLDGVVTRAAQGLRSYRADEVRLRAEEKYLRENKALAITEMILSTPGLYEEVNERLGKTGDTDQDEAVRIIAKDKRAQAAESIRKEDEADQQNRQRAEHVETYARRLSQKFDVPWEFVERGVEAAILRKQPGDRDLTDREIYDAVKDVSDDYSRHVRAHRREASKVAVQERTASRKGAVAKTPATAASPRPANRQRPKEIDWNNADSRRAPLMDLARRLFPGAKDSDD